MSYRIKHTPEFRDIISRVPDRYSSLFLYGLIVFIAAIITLGMIIKVPDIIVAETRITSNNPPTVIKSYSAGRLKMINDTLPRYFRKGDYIAYIDNPSDIKHVQHLKQMLWDVVLNESSLIENSLFSQPLKLGEIESPFYRFKEAVFNKSLLLGDYKYKFDIDILKRQIQSDSANLEYLMNVIEKNIQSHKIHTQNYRTDSSLYQQNAILLEQLNNTHLTLLNSEKQIMSNESEIAQLQDNISKSKLQVLNLEYEYQVALQNSEMMIEEYYNSLVTTIRLWENNYVFICPQDGTVEYANLIIDEIFIGMGDPIFNIIYENSDYSAIAILPPEGAGKVVPGQKVILKMALYPFQEFGSIEGIVHSISMNSIDKNYIVYIELPNGLISTTKKKLVFAETMYGSAEIITEEKNLIQRIFNSIHKLLSPDRKKINEEIPTESAIQF